MMAIAERMLQPMVVLCKSNNCPPNVPPKNAPRNCALALTPIAVALDSIGATFEIHEGKSASMTLNAMKNNPKPVSRIYFDS